MSTKPPGYNATKNLWKQMFTADAAALSIQ
jgi:hypothetical protein